jgi:hypothetical protein
MFLEEGMRMKKTIWATVCSTAFLAGFTTVMVRPPVSKAFTLVEMPAFVFPEVTVQGSQVPMLCMNNMGDGSVRTLIGLLDVADSSKAMSPLIPITLGAHQGTCALLPAVRPGPTTGAPGPASAIAAIFVSAGDANASATGGGGAGKGLVSSLQVRDEGGTRFVVTPIFMTGVTVPAASHLN